MSNYCNKFILKGGLYLSSILGIDNRTTIDIDFLVKKIKMEQTNIIKIIKDICNTPCDDKVTFKYVGFSNIKKDDNYGGFSITIEGRIENVHQQFDIDLATGDDIFPSECNYEYECLITHEKIQLKGYSIESVISEKLQTFLDMGILNSRSKDLYDLYILLKLKVNENNLPILKNAFIKTCKQRNFEISKDEAISTLNEISKNDMQIKRWNAYTKKAKYAQGISFEEIIYSIKVLLNIVM